MCRYRWCFNKEKLMFNAITSIYDIVDAFFKLRTWLMDSKQCFAITNILKNFHQQFIRQTGQASELKLKRVISNVEVYWLVSLSYDRNTHGVSRLLRSLFFFHENLVFSSVFSSVKSSSNILIFSQASGLLNFGEHQFLLLCCLHAPFWPLIPFSQVPATSHKN